MFIKIMLTVFVFCLFVISGCSLENKPPDKAVKSAMSSSNNISADSNKSDVFKIVFVGQKQACKCTLKRVETTWNALQKVMGKRKDIVLDKIQLDVEQKQADKLDALRSLIVAPGIYFFDEQEHLLEMLQGEVTTKQILKAL